MNTNRDSYLGSTHEGSVTRYQRGCRCFPCCEARRDYDASMKARRFAETLNPHDARHGTLSFHRNFGCRCERCCAISNQASLQARENRRQAASDPDDPRHGTANFYRSYMCRCDPCRKAQAEDYARSKR